jgi:hypothetical protein
LGAGAEPSLPKTLLRCISTVLGVTNRAWAMSRLIMAWAARVAIREAPTRPQSRLCAVSPLELAPEGVEAGVPLVRDLLEGLVGFPRQDGKACVGDCRGNGPADARWQDDVELAGQDERRRGDLR